jgi:hypothetical protein
VCPCRTTHVGWVEAHASLVIGTLPSPKHGGGGVGWWVFFPQHGVLSDYWLELASSYASVVTDVFTDISRQASMMVMLQTEEPQWGRVCVRRHTVHMVPATEVPPRAQAGTCKAEASPKQEDGQRVSVVVRTLQHRGQVGDFPFTLGSLSAVTQLRARPRGTCWIFACTATRGLGAGCWDDLGRLAFVGSRPERCTDLHSGSAWAGRCCDG